MTARRAWCFLVHRWWISTFEVLTSPPTYLCSRCGEEWSRA